MYFFASKAIGFVLTPSNLVVLILICGLLLWRKRFSKIGRSVCAAGVIMLLLGGASPLGTALLLPLENRFPPWISNTKAPAGMIVLGGVISPELSVERGEISVNEAAERLLAVVELYHQYPNARLLLVGGNANGFQGPSESELAAKLLENLGVPKQRIEIEAQSRNTRENASNALKLAKPKTGERWLLVTSAYHMPRAVGLFRNAGFFIEAYPVDWQTGGWGHISMISLPLLGGFSHLNTATHEWLALIFDWLSGRTPVLFPAP
jgi:uncharacterized SAM-binding protein YcdF (DUF218 family)